MTQEIEIKHLESSDLPRSIRPPQEASDLCCIPSEMVLVRYAGVDRAAGYRGMLVQARAGHLRIDIQDSNIATPWG
jgi:hypothetical protein